MNEDEEPAKLGCQESGIVPVIPLRIAELKGYGLGQVDFAQFMGKSELLGSEIPKREAERQPASSIRGFRKLRSGEER